MKSLYFLLAILFITASCSVTKNQKTVANNTKEVSKKKDTNHKPFPQATVYKNSIKPNHKSQNELNQDIVTYYEKWKEDYLRPTKMEGGYYVHGECTNCKVPSKGTSESHGYGMLITVMMAGQDSMAKTYFDGFFKFFDTHRSTLNNEMMGWNVAQDERSNAFESATDGDMDIAYALLLAHDQWGSNGTINYLQEAKDMITKGLKVSCINPKSKRVVLGDWDSTAWASRSSDWMNAQMRAYGKATNDPFWNEVIDTTYYLIDEITTNFSPTTGLVPDFTTGTPPQPVDDEFLEKETDNDYSWNACRYPWRVTMDYLHYGDARSLKAMALFSNWAKKSCNNDPAKFTSVFKLDGTPIETYNSTAFISPMLVACMVDSNNQEFLNKGWERVKADHYAYFNDSINLLCMMLMSGNWWIPEQ